MIRPIDDLELGLNYSHNDAEYKKFSYSPNSPAGTFDCNGFVPQGGTADESCLPMQYMAPNIFSAYARYAFPVSPQAGDVSLFVSYSWTDEQHTEALLPEQYQPGERLEAFGLINASLDWRNIAGVPLDVSLWGSNLSDKLYRISNSDVYQNGSLLYQATLYGEPRMYGVRVRYHWGK
jgi:iron complex outermembrane receptor protein